MKKKALLLLFPGALLFSSPVIFSIEQQKQLKQKIIKIKHSSEYSVNVITENLIELTFIPEYKRGVFLESPMDMEINKETDKYYLSSKSDSEYSDTEIEPLSVGLKRRTAYAPLKDDDFRLKESIYLKLPKNMTSGHTYTVSYNNQDIDFTYSTSRISNAIHLNPMGYSTLDKKHAFIGLEFGDDGELEVSNYGFEVLDLNSGEIVFNGVGTVQNSIGWNDDKYQHVIQLDFSDLELTGRYVIKHTELGISQPFMIEDNAFRKTLTTLAVGMYNQRRSEDITLPFSIDERLATVDNNTYIYDSENLPDFIKNDREFDGITYPTENEKKKVNLSGGHMDAGDYSIYTYNSSLLSSELLFALQILGESIEHDNLGIPESGDGVPDIYQELMVELKWLVDMQDDDGGVFGMSKPLHQSYQRTMTGEDKNLQRYLTPKDTSVTASFVATMALASRSKYISKYNPELQDIYREKAIKGWDWLEQNEGIDGWHHYGTREGDIDDRVWAATELYALTGELKYQTYIEENHKIDLRDNGVYLFNHGYGMATREIAFWNESYNDINFDLNETITTQCQLRYKEMMDQYVQHSNETPYNLILDPALKRWGRVGWFFPIHKFGYDLVLGAKLFNKTEYLDLAKEQMNYTLGANPLNKSFITGIGTNRVLSLVDQKSLYDSREQPVIGIPVAPISSDFSWNSLYNKDLYSFTFPTDRSFPLLEKYYDGWNVNGEFTIEKLGSMLIVAASFVENNSNQSIVYPKFTLLNNEGNVTIDFENPEINSSCSYMWFVNGLPESTQKTISINDLDADIYSLGLELIDNKTGGRWFDELLLSSNGYVQDNSIIQNNDSNASYLQWDFSSNLDSSDSFFDKALNYFGSNYYFDIENLFWMKHQSGSSLRIFNNSGVKGELSEESHPWDTVNEVSISSMVYLKSFFDISEAATILSFNQSWDNQITLRKVAWEKKLVLNLGRQDFLIDEYLLKPHVWHKIELNYSLLDLSSVVIDDVVVFLGQELEKQSLLDSRKINLTLGGFNGWVDNFTVKIK